MSERVGGASETVGVRELRQNLSAYLRRVAEGERLIVTDRKRRTLPEPLELSGDAAALSRALDEARGDR